MASEMTSLQSQLAALNGTSGHHPGTTYASSRRAQDALGRGFGFRRWYGHAVESNAARSKPSLLYDSPQEAAKVPLRTLADNGREAARNLSELVSHEASLSHHLALAFSPTVDASPETISLLLLHLSTLLAEDKDEVAENCLHVLEYLLRRYELHRSNNNNQAELWQDLVWCFLPHHALRATLLHRCLQLVDLGGGSNQSYLFLRHHANPQALVPVPRALIAQQLMKERNLLRLVCTKVQEATAWVDDHAAAAAALGSALPLRAGLGAFFAWTAACIVEGLAWQQAAPRQRVSDTEREAILRVLVPVVRHCATSTLDARTWACIVASAAAETLDLSDAVVQLWTTTLLEFANADHATDWTEAWVAVLSILVPPNQQTAVVDPASFVPLVGGKWLGCGLPAQTYAVAMPSSNDAASRRVARILGQLHHDEELQVAPLLGAFLARAAQRHHWSLLRALLHEASLESLWRHPVLQLLPSVAAWLATRAAENESPEAAPHYIEILKEWHTHDPAAAEQGFALALQQQPMDDDDDQGQRSKLVSILQQIVSLGDNVTMTDESEEAFSLPRVTLHNPKADSSQRIEAVDKLLARVGQDDTSQARRRLANDFLQLWSHEADFAVAQACGTAFCKLLLPQEHLSALDFLPEHPVLMLAGFYQWVESPKAETVAFLRVSLQMFHAALVVVALPDEQRQLLTEACLPYLTSKHENVATLAARAVAAALGPRRQGWATEKNDNTTELAKLVAQDQPFLQGVLTGLSAVKRSASLAAEWATRERCAVAILLLFAKEANLVDTEPLARYCLHLCQALFGGTNTATTTTVQTEAQEKIVACLQTCATFLAETIQETVVTVASFAESHYKHMGVSVLRAALSSSNVSSVAVLMEAVLQCVNNSSTVAAGRLMELTAKYGSKGTSESLPAILPLLTLLEHENAQIRKGALSCLSKICNSKDWDKCGEHFTGLKPVYKVLRVLGGASSIESLSGILSRCVSPKIRGTSRPALLHLCCLTARASTVSDTTVTLPSALDSPCTLEATAKVLKAMELSGEEEFPLAERFDLVGSHVAETILTHNGVAVVKNYGALMKVVVRMLTGRHVANSQPPFSSGPRVGGGRARSYSLGSMEGVKTLDPYPASMRDLILNVLQSRSVGGLELASAILQDLFIDNAWVDGVFSKFDSPTRTNQLSAVLSIVESDVLDNAATLFVKLPFEVADLSKVLADSCDSIGSASFVARFVSANVERLGRSAQGAELADALFKTLLWLASLKTSEEAGLEYARQAVVGSLRTLCYHVDLPVKPSDAIVKSLPVLTAMHHGVEGELVSKRQRALALHLTVALADKYPSVALQALRDSFKKALSDDVLSALSQKHRVELLVAVFGAFWKHSDSRTVTYGSVVQDTAECVLAKEINVQVLSDVLSSLRLSAPKAEECMAALGALAAFTIALSTESGVEAAVTVMAHAPVTMKMPSLVFILECIEGIISDIYPQDGRKADEKRGPLPSHGDIVNASCKEGTEKLEHLALLGGLADFLLRNLQSNGAEEMMQSGKGENAKFCLSLWQRALWMHAILQSVEHETTAGWQAFTDAMEGAKETIQSSMPMPLFLASVSEILNEDAAPDVVSHALEMVAARISEVDPDSAESSLFLDLLTDICGVIRDNLWSGNSTTAAQAALLAAEHIGRALFLGHDSNEPAGPCLEILKTIAQALETGSRSLGMEKAQFTDIKESHQDLICTLSLTASTLIRIVGVSALSHVPRLLPPVLHALSMANQETIRLGPDDRSSAPRNMQLGAVRAITAMAETVPQFLGPRIQSLLVQNVLLAQSLRSGSDASLSEAVKILDRAISVGVPARLFVPALARAIEAHRSTENVLVMVSMLQISMDGVSPKEAGALKGSVLACITGAFGCENLTEDPNLLKMSIAAVVSFVLKLSEEQLRQMYSALRDWKNALKPSDGIGPVDATRRMAFWSLSAALVSQLKSLFLPCATLVVDEISAELQHAVSLLCKPSAEKAHSGKKKRKLSLEKKPLYRGFTKVLQQVFLFLDRCLRADAREGGRWVRAEDGKRYNLFLESTAELLQSDFSPDSDDEVRLSYKDLVEGAEGGGNVVDCLTGMALAAGDEQLWKPLNYSVLQAVGNDGRSEVRRAGLCCLQSIMKTLGEEYMVLLPECLPALSELLEDQNEDIAGLARDVITLAEELLGESLEETLR